MTGRRTPLTAVGLIVTGVLATVLALAVTAGLASPFGPSGPDLAVSGTFMPQPVTAEIAGGYLTVTNRGDTADELTSVISDLSDDITMHQSVGDGMRQVTSFQIPAHATLELERGGSHLMFMGLDHKPLEGDHVSVKLHFAKAAPITLDIPVEAPAFNPKQDHDHEQ
ncbi:copper chaperone PCu(A)C [Streptomyces gobiensis]|uniref:copper chaperone PCu(A)C n=1 Tax=Streptomyces gobiensis TaxID=2875706 RepID=UPI001E553507|nr:copper chaperone PCu(A)C [Streptomyces gobiensis]UGY91276.1 copper chaperone PCu(A)C [Streptomyces gobiensis]